MSKFKTLFPNTEETKQSYAVTQRKYSFVSMQLM